jgi:hypothetical protein
MKISIAENSATLKTDTLQFSYQILIYEFFLARLDLITR